VSILRRHWAAVAAIVCAALAVFVLLLAADVRSWQTTMARDDVRFRALPGHSGLWRPTTLLPGDPARTLLGVSVALDYRHALQLVWNSRVGAAATSRTDLPTTRARAEESLQQLIVHAGDIRTRSSAANLLGVLVVSTPGSKDRQAQEQALKRGENLFQEAVRIDPSNDDAKLNLELLLRLRRPGKSKLGLAARRRYGLSRSRGGGVTGSGY